MATLLMNGKITTPGVQLPIRKVYQPILKELEEYGVVFTVMTYYGYKPDNKMNTSFFVVVR
jgi:hypothetical protein